MSVMPALASTAQSNGCRLVAVDGRTLPLRSVEVQADASGGLARVRLRQVFVNPYSEPLAATYQLPLPDDGAVVDFSFQLDGRRIAGRIERKADARAAFEQAVIEGRTAALLEQDRSSLFTQEIGNLPPGAEIQVEMEVEQLLRWVQGGWEWRWPTVVGPRYLGAPGETPDAARIEVAVGDGPLPVRCTASLRIGDVRTGAVSSPSHSLEAGGDAVGLSGSLDRDVVVRWPVAALAPGWTLELARPVGDAEAYGWLTLVPPARTPEQVVARDLCLLLDTSGSMSGIPLAQLVALSKALVGGLRPGDRLEMIEFSSRPSRWRKDVVQIDDRSRADALQWLDRLRAGGGTAMHEAVSEALRPLHPEAQRQVVLITDGYIGFEAEVIGRIVRGLPRGSCIHTVGIGSSVNRTLTRGVARAGGGHEAIVGTDETVDAAVTELLARTGDPLWVDVSVTGSAVREVAPKAAPDLLAGRPSRLALRLAPEGGTVTVTARGPNGLVSHEQQVSPLQMGSGRRVLATRFAREAVDDLELALAGGEPASRIDPAIEALGLRHRIATRLTSWVAATEEATVDPGDPTRREVIPHELPHGVSAAGVGLRQSAVAGKQAELAMPVQPMPVQATGTALPRRPAPGNAPTPPKSMAAPSAPAPRSNTVGSRAPEKEENVRRRISPGPAAEQEQERGITLHEEPASFGAGSARAADAEKAPAKGKKRAKSEEDTRAPQRSSVLQRVKDFFSGGASDQEESPEEADAPAETVSLRLVLGARVVSLGGGKLILEVQIDREVDWNPVNVVVFAADGGRHSMEPGSGTTSARRLSRGQVARLVLTWSAPTAPVRLTLGDSLCFLELVIR